MTFEQWQEAGRALAGVKSALQWALGDWWTHGEHHYGARIKTLREGAIGDLSFETLMTYGGVCRKVPTSIRIEVLSFSHHRQIVGIDDPVEQRRWLDRAAAEGWTMRQLHDALAYDAGGKDRYGMPTFKLPAVTATSEADDAALATSAAYDYEPDDAAEDSESIAGEALTIRPPAESDGHEPPELPEAEALALYHRGVNALVRVAKLPHDLFVADKSVGLIALVRIQNMLSEVIEARGGNTLLTIDAAAEPEAKKPADDGADFF
jgi:hypothetical protein